MQGVWLQQPLKMTVILKGKEQRITAEMIWAVLIKLSQSQ